VTGKFSYFVNYAMPLKTFIKLISKPTTGL